MRWRLLAVMVGVVALVLLVQDIPLVSHLRTVERDRLTTKLERDAFILAGRSEDQLSEGTEDPTLEGIVARYEEAEGVSVVVVDVDGLAVVGTSFDVGENFTNRPEIVEALSGRPTTGDRSSETLGGDLFYVAVPVLSGPDVVGAIRISAPASLISHEVQTRLAGLAIALLISVLIAAIAALVLSSTVTRPMRRLKVAPQRLADGDLGQRAEIAEGPSEMRSLARSFNTMAAQLEQLVARQRAFAGTASHQLRTPLTALRLRLETLAQHVSEADAEHAEAAIAEVDRLRRMIEGLLMLTRAEDTAIAPIPVDIAAVARDRAAHWLPLAEEAHVSITLTVPDSARALAVVGSVEQIIDNLVDNALDVCGPDGRIELAVQARGSLWDLHVIDNGPGLSVAEREEAFERFWRGGSSTPGGSGLGLAIVRQFVEAADGTVVLEESAMGGIDAVVTLHSA